MFHNLGYAGGLNLSFLSLTVELHEECKKRQVYLTFNKTMSWENSLYGINMSSQYPGLPKTHIVLHNKCIRHWNKS